MRVEAIVPWNRRINSGLSVRSRGDEVSIATRNTGLRALFATVFVAAILLYLYLWEANVFRTMDWFGTVLFHGMILLPVTIVGVFYAFPDQRLFASKSLGYLEVQHRWLGVPIIRRRVEAENCHRISVLTLGKETTVEEGISVPGTVFGLASTALFGIGWVSRKTRTAVLPVYATEIIRRDGSSILSHLTWSGEDCLRAMEAVWGLFPEFRPGPLVDTVGESLAAGDRVRVSLDHEWARGALGVVKEPPPAVAKFGAPWEGLRRYEDPPSGRLVFYWIEFDEPQTGPGGDGPLGAAEIDSRYLERA